MMNKIQMKEYERQEYKDNITLIKIGDDYYSEAYEEHVYIAKLIVLFQINHDRFALITGSSLDDFVIEVVQALRAVLKARGTCFDSQEDFDELHQIVKICGLGAKILHIMNMPTIEDFGGCQEVFDETWDFLTEPY